ncbi:MAG: HAD family hydrolase [Candidatus Marsarchaeota archaeon]|nr:HAD family hydrolase [Candidatus Marsarchaeota archaeon]
MEHFALFDTNMTIVSDAKDVSRYFAESIMNIYGLVVEVDLKAHMGLSAKELAMETLKENGLNEQEIQDRLSRLLEDLPYSYYNVAWSDKIIVSDGAKQLLDDLKGRGVGLGIATGEPMRISRMRLDRVKMAGYFTFGSYAEDGMTPKEIIDTALNRASSEFGLQAEEGFFFSASPRFVRAAREAGVYSVGVASMSSAADLSSAGANETMHSLKEKPRLFKEL